MQWLGWFLFWKYILSSNLESNSQLLGLWVQAKEPSTAITFFSKFSQVFLQADNVVFLQVAIKLE